MIDLTLTLREDDWTVLAVLDDGFLTEGVRFIVTRSGKASQVWMGEEHVMWVVPVWLEVGAVFEVTMAPKITHILDVT